ncbi:hypothetical protein H8D30_03500 [bacterium]|nr:hypothetical protein [bacterium]
MTFTFLFILLNMGWNLEEESKLIQSDLSEIRGLPFLRDVAVASINTEGFLDYARRRMEMENSPEEQASWEVAASLLGLLPPQTDIEAETLSLLEEQVGGFYDPPTETMYVMEGFEGGVARMILAHELTHALDDQHYGLDEGIEARQGNSDALFAYQAVVEGSGVAMMTRWMIAHITELSREDLQEAQGAGSAGFGTAPPLLWKPLIAVYMAGDLFLKAGPNAPHTMMKQAVGEDIDTALETPPLSSEQILHPEKYWSDEERDDPVVVQWDASRLLAGWAVVGEDTLGEILLALLTTSPDQGGGFDPNNPLSLLRLRFTNDAAKGWGGDRYIHIQRGEEHALRLHTVWDTPKDAAEFGVAL